jgi:hypothetical protein
MRNHNIDEIVDSAPLGLNGPHAIRRTKKPPACAGGFFQFANKVLIALP